MKNLFLFFPILLLFGSCTQKAAQSPEEKPTHQNCNAVYYWKTTFRLSAEERDFLATHQVKRLYLRYFDVYKDPDINASVVPVPQATLQFMDSVPSDLEVVPIVFIDNNLFKDCDLSQYTGLLVNRILTMTKTNDVPNVHEVQLDCDWTSCSAKRLASPSSGQTFKTVSLFLISSSVDITAKNLPYWQELSPQRRSRDSLLKNLQGTYILLSDST